MDTSKAAVPVILCVDDEPIGLMVRAKVLELAGFSVLTAPDGASALELYGSRAIDLVLLDYLMPRMHGGEVAQAMRALNPRTPIVLLSAHPQLPPEVAATADLCLAKGMEPEELIGTLRSLLGQSREEAR